MSRVIAETERLIIREFNINDVQDVYEFGRHPQVNRYTGDSGSIESLADAKGVVENVWLAEYAKYGYARWAVEDKATGRVIGFCGFKNDDRINATDLGYRLLPEYWGKGLASEACRACMTYAKQQMDLDHILGEVVIQNKGSIRVLEKLGFEFSNQYEELGFTINRYELWLKSE